LLSTTLGTYANPAISKHTPATPVRNATITSTGIDSQSSKRGDRNHRQQNSTGDIGGNHDPPMLTTFHPMPDQERKKQVGQHPGRGNRAYLPWSGRQRQRSD
jgi:hypothetical protein